MFATSTQKKYWNFPDETSLDKFRYDTNQNYINKYTEKYQGFIESPSEVFLTIEEEKELLAYYSQTLWDFCIKFPNGLPKSIIATSFVYFKRFYLNTSVMDYHPKEILITCAFLACKIDEFNLTLPQFLNHIRGDKNRLTQVIMSHEVKIINGLNFQLVVHTPYRPLEGFFIDIKTRFPSLRDPEKLRVGAEMFLDKLLFTDAYFRFPPSQMALAALVANAEKIGDCLDGYIDLLTEDATLEDKTILLNSIQEMRTLTDDPYIGPDIPVKGIKIIEQKLEKCRNPENNPITPQFLKKIRIEMELDEESHHEPSVEHDEESLEP